MMIEIAGTPIEFDFKSLTQDQIFEWYDGPLIVSFKKVNNQYLFVFVDSDEIYNRWIVTELTEEQLTDYAENKTSLYNTMTINGTVMMVDIDNDLYHHNIKSVNVKDIPEDYLPEEDYFAEE